MKGFIGLTVRYFNGVRIQVKGDGGLYEMNMILKTAVENDTNAHVIFIWNQVIQQDTHP